MWVGERAAMVFAAVSCSQECKSCLLQGARRKAPTPMPASCTHKHPSQGSRQQGSAAGRAARQALTMRFMKMEVTGVVTSRMPSPMNVAQLREAETGWGE